MKNDIDFESSRPVNERRQEQHEKHGPRANKVPLPGALGEAFAGGQAGFGDVSFRPVVLGDFMVLRRLGNPMYEWLHHMDEEHLSKLQFDFEQLMEVVYLFRIPAEEADKLARSGKEKFREAAMDQDLVNIPLGNMNEIAAAIMTNFARSVSTTVGHRAPSTEGFQKPQPEGSQTGSVGG